jgi:hypothetical protein
MYPHELESFYRWYSYVPITILTMIVLFLVISERTKLAISPYWNRSLRPLCQVLRLWLWGTILATATVLLVRSMPIRTWDAAGWIGFLIDSFWVFGFYSFYGTVAALLAIVGLARLASLFTKSVNFFLGKLAGARKIPRLCSECYWRIAMIQVQPRETAEKAGRAADKAWYNALENMATMGNRGDASSGLAGLDDRTPSWGVLPVNVGNWPFVCEHCFRRGGGPLQDSRFFDPSFPKLWRRIERAPRGRRDMNLRHEFWKGRDRSLALVGQSLPALLEQVTFPAGPCALCGGTPVTKIAPISTGRIECGMFLFPERTYGIPLCESCARSADLHVHNGTVRIRVGGQLLKNMKVVKNSMSSARPMPDIYYLELTLSTQADVPPFNDYIRAFWASNWARAIDV